MSNTTPREITGKTTRLLIIGLMVVFTASCSSSFRSSRSPYAQDTSVVAVYGDEVLTLDKFEEQYVRSIGSYELAAADSLPAYEDFLDRFVNFRLKVMAANDQGLRESREILDEINLYRTSLARPYLLEQEVLAPIIQDLYVKRQEMIDASHIIKQVRPGDPPADTLASYQQMTALIDSIRMGLDFGDLAFQHSDDPSARRNGGAGYRGRLGYFSAGRMVEPFENMAYATPVGEISPLFRTNYGYHVLYVHDRTRAAPDIRVAHIMLQPGPTPADSLAKKQLAQEIIGRHNQGEAFEALAREYSTDQASAEKGGDLGILSYTSVVPSFRDAAFALENEGDISGIVATAYGFHVIKLLERIPVQTFEAVYSDLKTQAAQSTRAKEAEKLFADSILVVRNAQIDTTFVLGAFAGIPADSVFNKLVTETLPEPILSHPFFVLGDSSFTLLDVGRFSKQAALVRNTDTNAQVMSILEGFLTQKAVDYEASLLEYTDEEFSAVMQEFRDGLVLFKLMEDSVWSQAERDSIGLRTYFDEHAHEYNFPERTRVIGFHSRSDSILLAIGNQLDEGKTVAAIWDEYEPDTLQTLRIDTLLVSGPTNSVYDFALSLPEGAHSSPRANRVDFIVLLNDGILPAGPKTFEEARTEVIGEYQKVIENALIDELRDRYRAVVFPTRLRHAFTDSEES